MINSNLLVEVESYGILEVFKFIEKEKLKRCIIYSDVKIVVDDIEKGKLYLWRIVNFLNEIDNLCKISSSSIFFIFRRYNFLVYNFVVFINFVGMLIEEVELFFSVINSM